MQRKLALLGLALALLGLALWFATTRGIDATRVAEEPARPSASRPVAEVAAEPSSSARADESPAPPAASARVRVRSSAGLPLAFVEIERAGKWSRVELTDGGFDAGALGLPLRVRAPGHVARGLEYLEAELVLEPDALLVIEGADLRACLAELTVEDDSCGRLEDFREARTRAVLADWISDTSFGIAVACDRVEPLPPELLVHLVRSDRMRLYLRLAWKPGLRGRWKMPCEGQQAGTPLEVHVVRPPGPRGRLTVQIQSPAQDGLSFAGHSDEWGQVGGFSLDLWEERTIAAEEDVVRFPFALPGRKHFAAALDADTHAYGRIEFVHDGKAQVLPLREGLEFRGRVVEAGNHEPLRNVYLRFQGVEEQGWTIEAQQLKLGEGGSFVLRGPKSISAWRVDALDPPRSFALSAEAPGYDALVLLVERTGTTVLDVGDVALRRHQNPVVLAPGHGIAAGELDGLYIAFADKSEEAWCTLPGVALEDGRLEIEFWTSNRADRPERLVMRDNLVGGDEVSVPFERTLGTILFVHVTDDVRTFRLESDGLYHRVGETKLKLTLYTEQLAPGDKSWHVGWSWNGGWSSAGMLASNIPGQEREVELTVPEGAQQLWWSSTGIPPDLRGDPGGFQTIRGSAIKLVLR